MAYVIGEDCIACGTCIDECPVGAISEGERYSINEQERAALRGGSLRLWVSVQSLRASFLKSGRLVSNG